MPETRYADSADGTRIAYQVVGAGPPTLLVGGAFTDRTTMAPLAGLLGEDRTVVCYDRRGRGDSEPGPPLDGDHRRAAAELADLHAVIAAVSSTHVSADGPGGSPGDMAGGWHVVGHSSGAVLGLLAAGSAATARAEITRVTAYEPTWIVPGARPLPPASYRADVLRAVATGDPDTACALFLEHSALVPADAIAQMRATPAWAGMRALAHSLPFDLALHPEGWEPPALTFGAGTRAEILVGGDSPRWFHATAASVAADAGATHAVLPGQDHTILWQPRSLADWILTPG